MKPYSFEAVYPIEQVIDVGRRAAKGEIDFQLGEDISGCLGCVCKKLGGGDDIAPFGAGVEDMPEGVNLEAGSVEELGEQLQLACQTYGATEEGSGAIPPWAIPILIELGKRIFARLFNR